MPSPNTRLSPSGAPLARPGNSGYRYRMIQDAANAAVLPVTAVVQPVTRSDASAFELQFLGCRPDRFYNAMALIDVDTLSSEAAGSFVARFQYRINAGAWVNGSLPQMGVSVLEMPFGVQNRGVNLISLAGSIFGLAFDDTFTVRLAVSATNNLEFAIREDAHVWMQLEETV